MENATELLAMRRVIELSAKIEATLTSKGEDILLAVLAGARNRAADALTALITVDPEKPSAIRTLQNEIELFGLLVDHLQTIVANGVTAAGELSETFREEMADVILTDEDRVALGIPDERASQ